MSKVTPEVAMDSQRKANWCWAAVAAAVHSHAPEDASQGRASPARSQCEIASAVLPDSVDCCNDPDSCDRPFGLLAALGPRCFQLLNMRLRFDDIREEVEKHNRPICARIAWDPDGDGVSFTAHFVLIVGCEFRAGVPHVLVKDPLVGTPPARGMGAATAAKSVAVPYDDFCIAYELAGVWTHTYRIT